MGQGPKIAYLKEILKRYKKSNRKLKTKILDEFCEICGFNRKYAIQRINAPKKPKKKKPGPEVFYKPEVILEPLQRIWLASDQAGSKKLKVIIAEWLPFYELEYGELAAEVRSKLLNISPASIDRVLQPVRVKHPRKGLGGTKPGSLLKKHIPIKLDQWDETRPGFLEADTVAHCGDSLEGSFVWSITLTDIATAWTENRATWNKGAQGVIEQIKDVEQRLPFKILGFDSDNGSEFLNHHLLRYFVERPQEVQFTRSRPYHKNDNAHVEQKNWTHVRQLLGYDRLDNPDLISLINDLYANEWSQYKNHFMPTAKLVEKKRVGSKIKKRHSPLITPYQRVLDSEYVSDEEKARLIKQHASLSPFKLKKQMEKKLKKIFSLVQITTHVRKRL